MNKKNQVGRPTENEGKRDKLLLAARSLFLEFDYDKVSLREIAKKAQVDSALIRYYFQSKLGLFTTMLEETAAPITSQLRSSIQKGNESSSEMLMATYYSVMSENPDFPKLILKMASMPSSDKNIHFQTIIEQILRPKNNKLFSAMQDNGILKDGVDPLCAQISFFSMMVFPFLMPDMIKKAMGIELTPEFLNKLCQQNTQLLQSGCMSAPDSHRLNNEEK